MAHEVGCVVRLRSDGPAMTVAGGTHSTSTCVWIDSHGLSHEQEFPDALLEVVKYPLGPHPDVQEPDEVLPTPEDIKGPRPSISIHDAARSGDIEQLRRHLEWGTNIEQRGEPPLEATPLIEAAFAGQLDAVKFLVDNRAHIDALDCTGTSAVYHAAGRGHVEVVKYLLSERASIESENTTLLHAAAKGGSEWLVRLLLKRGANVNAPGTLGVTPLHEAADACHAAVVQLLIKHGAEVDGEKRAVATPLSMAVRRGCVAVIRLLLEHGADPSVPSSALNDLYAQFDPKTYHEIENLLDSYRKDIG